MVHRAHGAASAALDEVRRLSTEVVGRLEAFESAALAPADESQAVQRRRAGVWSGAA